MSDAGAAAGRNDLQQSTTWTDSAGRAHRIERMPHDHAANSASWLVANAVSLLMAADLASGTGPTSRRIAEVLANPRKHMEATPLHKALTRRANAWQPLARRPKEGR